MKGLVNIFAYTAMMTVMSTRLITLKIQISNDLPEGMMPWMTEAIIP
jgi:hypothetical protein